MKLLELFSGAGSVGAVAKQLGYEDTSLDKDMMADQRCDIMDFDYEVFVPETFDVIWVSPRCTEYSRAETIGTRSIAFANVIVNQTQKIIKHLKPKYWFIENPQTGL